MVLGLGNTVEIVIRARDQFSKAFTKAQLSMQSFRKAALGMGIVVAGLSAGIMSAVRASLDLEDAMVNVRKTTGLSAVKIEALRQEFIGLSQTIPLSVVELAEIGAVAGQLGIQGTEDIKSFTTTVAKMAIATELSAEDAALALAKISNAFQLPISESEKLGSAINELSNISAASSSEIVEAMKKAAGSAATLGLSAKNVAGMTAALIASGEQASRAGSRMQSAFNMVIVKMEDEVIPLMGKDFPDALRRDADDAILQLIRRISQIEDPLERQATALKVFGNVGAAAMNKLANNMPEVIRLIAASSGQFENATSLQNEFDIAAESTRNQLRLLSNQFDALKLELADELIPVIRDSLIPWMRNILDWMRAVSDETKQAGIILAGFTIVIGGLTVAVAALSFVLGAALWPLTLLIGLFTLAYIAGAGFKRIIDENITPALDRGNGVLGKYVELLKELFRMLKRLASMPGGAGLLGLIGITGGPSDKISSGSSSSSSSGINPNAFSSGQFASNADYENFKKAQDIISKFGSESGQLKYIPEIKTAQGTVVNLTVQGDLVGMDSPDVIEKFGRGVSDMINNQVGN